MKLALAALLAAPTLALAQPVPLPAAEELLQIAFPKWQDEEGGRVQPIPATSATLAWRMDAPRKRIKKGRTRDVEIVPRHVVRVGTDRVLLLATMNPVSAQGVSEVSHGTPTGLAAFTFKPGKDGWTLVKRQEPFDLQGFEGRVGLDLLPLTAKAQALHVSWGSCWQGRCVDLVALYALNADGVAATPLLLQKIKGGNVYSRPDCVERLRAYLPQLAPPDGVDEPVAPGQCYAIEGRMDLVATQAMPGPLTLRFKGARSNAGKQGNAAAERIEQAMKFEFRGGRYVPVSGRNPVPNA